MKEARGGANTRLEDSDLLALVARLESAHRQGDEFGEHRAHGGRRRAKAAALAPGAQGAAHLAPVFLAIGAAGLGAFVLILLGGFGG